MSFVVTVPVLGLEKEEGDANHLRHEMVSLNSNEEDALQSPISFGGVAK